MRSKCRGSATPSRRARPSHGTEDSSSRYHDSDVSGELVGVRFVREKTERRRGTRALVRERDGRLPVGRSVSRAPKGHRWSELRRDSDRGRSSTVGSNAVHGGTRQRRSEDSSGRETGRSGFRHVRQSRLRARGSVPLRERFRGS